MVIPDDCLFKIVSVQRPYVKWFFPLDRVSLLRVVSLMVYSRRKAPRMKTLLFHILVCVPVCAVVFPLVGCASLSLSVGVSLPFSDTEQEIVASFSDDGMHFPMVVNDEVLDELEALSRSPYSIKKWLSRSQRYVPMMRGIFREYGVPEELVYVAIIESGFDAEAVSVKDAGGPWQLSLIHISEPTRPY